MMSIPEFDITGQKVLIVGGGRGIGKGIALAFAEAGADVAVSALTPTGVHKVAGEIRALGRNALALTGDATKAADMDRVAQQVLDKFGHLDTLVTCVGDSIRKPVVQLPGTATPGMTEDEWHFIVNVNLTEAFQGCRALGPHLLARRQGSVVNISGWASFRGRAGSAAYDAAKAGVMRFTESLAQEWAPFGVRVNAVAPGSFPDPEQISAEAYQQREVTAAKTVPLGRVGRLKEVGYLAVFLASPAAAYVTGQTWAVDGGVSIQSA
jgi:NAD(P)-dependent dehydrogenase (short-subunit alcohol dehydrogenase family)